MTLMVEPPVGEPYEYHASSALNLRLTAEPILAGLTYPALMFLDDVRTVVDAGANCGAASIHFALAYPDATVHAVEPGLEQLDLLRRNVRGFPRVQVHPVGLSSEDREAPYVRRDVADHPEAMPFLIRTVAARRAG